MPDFFVNTILFAVLIVFSVACLLSFKNFYDDKPLPYYWFSAVSLGFSVLFICKTIIWMSASTGTVKTYASSLFERVPTPIKVKDAFSFLTTKLTNENSLNLIFICLVVYVVTLFVIRIFGRIKALRPRSLIYIAILGSSLSRCEISYFKNDTIKYGYLFVAAFSLWIICLIIEKCMKIHNETQKQKEEVKKINSVQKNKNLKNT